MRNLCNHAQLGRRHGVSVFCFYCHICHNYSLLVEITLNFNTIAEVMASGQSSAQKIEKDIFVADCGWKHIKSEHLGMPGKSAKSLFKNSVLLEKSVLYALDMIKLHGDYFLVKSTSSEKRYDVFMADSGLTFGTDHENFLRVVMDPVDPILMTAYPVRFCGDYINRYIIILFSAPDTIGTKKTHR